MAVYRLSRKAAGDIGSIHEYTIGSFGLDQARSYLNGLHERLRNLAQQPMLGRKAVGLQPGLRRYEYRSHVVFYTPNDSGVTIVRVLHGSMDATRHLLDDEDLP